MKRALFLLVCVGFFIPQVFAGPSMQQSGRQQTSRQQSTRQQSTKQQKTRQESIGAKAFETDPASFKPVTAEAADIDEVPEWDYTIDVRQNPNTKASVTNRVYAQKAQVIKPELERLPPPVYAISGVRGQYLGSFNAEEIVDIVIKFPGNERLAANIREGEDLTGWFDNLPPGLVALAHGVKKGAAQMRIYITGTPETTRRSEVQLTVPGRYLSSNRNMHFGSPEEEASIEAWKIQEDAPDSASGAGGAN